MKTKAFYFLLLGVLVLAACKGSSDLHAFIPGTYVDYAKGEYSESFDTIIVGEFNPGRRTYPVIRNSGFKRLENGKVGPLEHMNEKWIGLWDEESKTIQVPKNLKIISFYPDSNLLILGTRGYRKLGVD